MNLSFLAENIRRFEKNSKNHFDGLDRYKAWISEFYCLLRHGCSPDDYFRYEFYRKSDYERSKFITWRRSQKLIRQYNNKDFCKYFQEKSLFNEKFSAFLDREWLYVGRASENEFRNLVHKYGEIFLKPCGGGQGKGIIKISVDDLDHFDMNVYSNYLAEQPIQQHPRMALLNSTSVNSVRVLTFKGYIIACALRIGGSDAIVDNLHSNGVCAHLDVETGIIDSVCINNNLEKFLFHPSSQVKLVGFQVPNWDKILSTAKEAARIVPQVQYVGWDIAVTEDGTALIEGNHDPGHDVVQMIAQTGVYSLIRELELI